MKRVALYFAAILVLTLTFSEILGMIAAIVILFVSAACMLIFGIIKIRPISQFALLMCVMGFISGVFTVSHYYLTVAPVEDLAGKQAVIRGTVIEEPSLRENSTILSVKTSVVECNSAVPQHIQLKLFCESNFAADPNDTIETSVIFYKPDRKSNYYNAKVYIGAYCTSDVEIVDFGKNNTVMSFFISLRERLRSAVRLNFSSDTAGIVSGLLVGDTDLMPDSIYKTFKDAGILHLMAVSGMHVSIICGLIMSLLTRAGINKRISSLIAIPFLIAFAALSGFTSSCVRATVMYIVFLLGNAAMQKGDSLNSLGFAVGFMLFVNPYNIYDIGFQLSALCCLGIIVVAPKIRHFMASVFQKNHISAVGNFVCDSISVSLATTVMIIPVSFLELKTLSFITPLSNLLVLSAAAVDMVLAVFAAPLMLLPINIPLGIITSPIEIISFYILKVAQLTSSLTCAYTSIYGIWAAAWICGVCLMIIASYVICKKIKTGYVVLSSIALCVCLSIAGGFAGSSAGTTVFTDDCRFGAVIHDSNRYIAILTDPEISGTVDSWAKNNGLGNAGAVIITQNSIIAQDEICGIPYNSSKVCVFGQQGLALLNTKNEAEAGRLDSYSFNNTSIDFITCDSGNIAVRIRNQNDIGLIYLGGDILTEEINGCYNFIIVDGDLPQGVSLAENGSLITVSRSSPVRYGEEIYVNDPGKEIAAGSYSAVTVSPDSQYTVKAD